MSELLRLGSVYEIPKNGRMEYLGIDVYHGETTFKFRSVEYGSVRYMLPKAYDEFMAEAPAASPTAADYEQAIAEIEELSEPSGYFAMCIRRIRKRVEDIARQRGRAPPEDPSGA